MIIAYEYEHSPAELKSDPYLQKPVRQDDLIRLARPDVSHERWQLTIHCFRFGHGLEGQAFTR